MGQANPKSVLPSQWAYRKNRGGRTGVDGQADGGRNDSVEIIL